MYNSGIPVPREYGNTDALSLRRSSEIDNNKVILTFYVVKSDDGKYFRNRGWNGSGSVYDKSWVDDIKNAKFYTKIGQARSRVTFWKKNYPEYPTPQIIELQVTRQVVIDETERVKKTIKKQKENELKAEKERKERDIKRLQEQQEKIAQDLQNLLNTKDEPK